MPGISLRLSAAAALVVVLWLWRDGLGDTVDQPVSTAEASQQTAWRESDLWLAPDVDPTGPSELAQGIARLTAGAFADALPLVSKSLADPVLGPYARLYVGRALLALEDHQRAAEAARHVLESPPSARVRESALWLLAQSLEIAEAWDEAVPVWRTLASVLPQAPSTVQLRLARAAEQAGDRAAAREAYARVYYEWPLTVDAADASAALARFPSEPLAATFERERARAEALYGARRFADARRAFELVQPRASGAARAAIDLRLAQCDVELRRFAKGLEALSAYLARYPRAEGRVEAEFFTLAALRGLKRPTYPQRVRQFVRDHPDSPLAERALNELATHHILEDDDARAAVVFADMYARYPQGAFADRAAWRAGWWAYRRGEYRDAIRLFESASAGMRRADYRPAWLYWTARAYDKLKQHDAARLWYLRTMADYRNSYYGREAERALAQLPGGRWTPADVAAHRDPSRAITAGTPPVNAGLVRRLLEAGLWDDAVAELRYGRAEPATPAVIDATIAYALNRKGELRPAITAMRRAYPQFMSDGGEQLPTRMRRVIFPIAHRDVLERYARERGIDLHLLTALVAQESTFQADVRSPANAWGLMQLLPATGQRYARKINLRGYTAARLTDPETNVQLGTAYLADLLAQFGDIAPALAAYNAGEHRVVRWLAERPKLPRDEFVDDIPFPETQNYVKRIIGTAEDYRLLYGSQETAMTGTGR